MKCNLVLAAEKIILDKGSNRISAIDIFTDLTVEGFPLYFQNFSLLTVFNREEGEPEIFEKDIIIKIDDDKIFTGKAKGNFQGAKNTRGIINIEGLTVTKPGNFVVEIFLAEQKVNEFSFLVNPPEAKVTKKK